MNAQKARELGKQIQELQTLMIAYVTDGRSKEQPAEYRELYANVHIALEESRYANPNPYKSLEVFWAFCKLQELKTYASRRVYVEELYGDILLDLKRIQAHKPAPKTWTKANDALSDELTPIRTQWLKAKNFIKRKRNSFSISRAQQSSTLLQRSGVPHRRLTRRSSGQGACIGIVDTPT
jgi:hypothetical protein